MSSWLDGLCEVVARRDPLRDIACVATHLTTSEVDMTPMQATLKAAKAFCSDKDRAQMYLRYKVADGIAACTDGHKAAYWPTSEPNGVYTLDGTRMAEDTMPDVVAVLPSRAASIAVRQRLQLPQLTAKRQVGIALCKRDNRLYWVALAPDGYADPMVAAFDANYLSAVVALCGERPFVEIEDALSPALFFREEMAVDAPYSAAQSPFCVVMPMRV